MSFINTETLEYPITEQNIRDHFPDRSLSVLVPFVPPPPFAEVAEVAPPVVDTIQQEVSESTPAPINGKWTQAWKVVARDQLTADTLLATARTNSASQIDADVDAIYGDTIGNRAEEYRLAEEQANTYIADGYAGPVPSSVQSWADAKGWTPQAAADDISKTAAKWRSAQATIRSNRLLKKEQARTAVDQATLKTVMTSWSGFVAAVRGQLGI